LCKLVLLIHRVADFYHVHCFEKIADFSQADFLDRIQPLTRNLTQLRDLKSSSVLDGNYLVDAGAERLVIEWKGTVGKLIDKRDGVEIETVDSSHSAFGDLFRKSGSSSYVPQMVPNLSTFEFLLLSGTLAPIESDGPEDAEEWNLFEEYSVVADDCPEDLNNRHSLSETLEDWRRAIVSLSLTN
jgi:hypothetical protein